jgi:hypothetical protein
MGQYKPNIVTPLWKPSYEKRVMTREREGWKQAPGRRTKRRKELEKAALGTYEKGFHRGRGMMTGTYVLLELISRLLFDKILAKRMGR